MSEDDLGGRLGRIEAQIDALHVELDRLGTALRELSDLLTEDRHVV